MNNRTVPILIVVIVVIAGVILLATANNNRGGTAPQTVPPTTQSTLQPTVQPTTEPLATTAITDAAPVATEAPTEAATKAPTVAAQTFTLINLNTATQEQLMTIPDMSSRMVREFFEYRPYVSIQQFRREIGKYVDEAQVAAYEAHVYVPVNINDADAETLKQIPGVDDSIASALMAARPYANNDAFLQKLAESLSAEQVALAKNYLEQ